MASFSHQNISHLIVWTTHIPCMLPNNFITGIWVLVLFTWLVQRCLIFYFIFYIYIFFGFFVFKRVLIPLCLVLSNPLMLLELLQWPPCAFLLICFKSWTGEKPATKIIQTFWNAQASSQMSRWSSPTPTSNPFLRFFLVIALDKIIFAKQYCNSKTKPLNCMAKKLQFRVCQTCQC